jgi:hypothetical protein
MAYTCLLDFGTANALQDTRRASLLRGSVLPTKQQTYLDEDFERGVLAQQCGKPRDGRARCGRELGAREAELYTVGQRREGLERINSTPPTPDHHIPTPRTM